MDRDDADLIRGEFDRPGFGEADQSPLGSGIVRESVHATQAGDGRVIDDDAGLTHDEVRYDVFGDDPCSLEVDVEHGIPGLFSEFVGEAVEADAGVIEEDVDLSELVDGAVDLFGDGGFVANVGDEGDSTDAERLAFLTE